MLDRLLDRVPKRWHAEIRLGLQEALVNAVKHGNHLDPQKVISVRYRASGNQYWWVIEDQGGGFDFSRCCCPDECDPTVHEQGGAVNDCGRGLYILHQIFDEVRWDRGGRELHLCKRVRSWFQMPLVH
ncbi:MAG: ATP-binding protein [Cyanobacteria bacterium J06626_18]